PYGREAAFFGRERVGERPVEHLAVGCAGVTEARDLKTECRHARTLSPFPRQTAWRGAALLAREQLVDDLHQLSQAAAAHGLDLDDPAVGERERDPRDEAVAHGDDLRDLSEVDRARIARRYAAPERRLAQQH